MFLHEMKIGVAAYFQVRKVVSDNHLWRYIAVPGVLSLAYVVLLISAGWSYLPETAASLNEAMPGFLNSGVMTVILEVVLWIVLLLAGYVSYKFVILTIFSPFLSFLSEKTETALYQRPGPDFTLKIFLRDLWRGIRINVRNLFLMLFFTILVWLFTLIPLIGALISGICMLLIQFYYDGFSLADYTLERKEFSVGESVKFVRRNRPRIMGVGLGFMAMMLIPVVGWFIAPSFGAVAATIVVLDKMET